MNEYYEYTVLTKDLKFEENQMYNGYCFPGGKAVKQQELRS
jgi:hypothetical protein